MALDTRYRPLRFEDVIGQENTVTVLRQFVKSGSGFHQSYLFCGGHGSGKCVVGDTLVPTDRGMVPIVSLMGERKVDSTDVLVLKEGGHFVRAAYTYRGGVQKTVLIRTRLGYTLEGTPNHRIRVMTRDGVVDWASLGEIAVGDFACIVRGGPFGAGADLSGFGNQQQSPSKAAYAPPFRPPDMLTSEWGRLMGYIVGNRASLGDDFVLLNLEADTRGDMLGLLQNLCGIRGENLDKRILSHLYDFLNFAGVHRGVAEDKVVPWSVRASPAPVIREFLRGFMEAIGSVGRGGIGVTTKSVSLAHGLHLLFLQLGIVSRLSKRTTHGQGATYRINIMGTSYVRYEQEVGFFSARKKKALRDLVLITSTSKRRVVNKCDVVPYQQTHLNRLYEQTLQPIQAIEKARYFRRRNVRITAEDVASLADVYGDTHFQTLASFGYVFDPIVNVVHREAHVYDLSVPEGEMFAANGFMNHNTTLGRILARALLCENPQDGNPCDACTSCRSILDRGTSDCFVEVDAATNSSKDDVKEITDLLQYDTFSGRRRIYLFDEAHRLSKDALDALLKPMEDTVPGGDEKLLICIFCTTEPEKMRATIRSRCAPAFVIRRVSAESIADRLVVVCEREGLAYERAALVMVAEATECHIRDALKSVEGVSQLGAINVANVKSYLRLNANSILLGVLACVGHDLSRALALAHDLQEVLSPGSVYERLADLSMLAYRAGLGVGKLPSYWNEQSVRKLADLHGVHLVKFAQVLSSKPGHPTFAMLDCDLATLHFERRGEFKSLVTPAPSSQTLPNPPISPAVSAPIRAAESFESGRIEVVEQIPSTPPPSPTPSVARTTKGGVYIDPRAIKRKDPVELRQTHDGHMPPIGTSEFRSGLRRLVEELSIDVRGVRSKG